MKIGIELTRRDCRVLVARARHSPSAEDSSTDVPHQPKTSTATILATEGGAKAPDAQVLADERRVFEPGTTPAAQWLQLLDAVGAACARAAVEPSQCDALLAFDGPIDAFGRVLPASETQGWEGYDLARGLREPLQTRTVRVAPRALALGVAEATYGALTGLDQWFFLRLGRFVSGALRCGGSIVAADPGSILVERDGAMDARGRRGTFDAYCGASGFEGRAQAFGLTFRAAHEVPLMAPANFAAQSLTDDFVMRLASAVADILAVTRTRTLALGGPFGRAIFPLIERAFWLELRESAPAAALVDFELRLSPLGDEAGALGALALADFTPAD